MARGGIDQSDEMMRGAARFPRLKLKAGDRARFHFLASGGPGDPNLLAALFHSVDTGGTYPRDIVCLDRMTGGEESCRYCEQGNDDMSRRFAIWAYVHSIFHNGNNPDADGDDWPAVKVDGRTMFKETVAAPILIWLGVGRKMSRWGQFKAAYAKYGTLEGRLFDIRRVGAELDTEYTLTMVKEMDAPKMEEELTPIEDVFRATLGGASRPPRLAEGIDEEAPFEPGILEGELIPTAVAEEEAGEELL